MSNQTRAQAALAAHVQKEPRIKNGTRCVIEYQTADGLTRWRQGVILNAFQGSYCRVYRFRSDEGFLHWVSRHEVCIPR